MEKNRIAVVGGKVDERGSCRISAGEGIGRMAYAAQGSNPHRFPAASLGTIAFDPMFVPPNADRDARFQMQFLQDMLHVLLHSAGAALQNFSDLGVTLARRDPIHNFKLAPG
jgi:hypothetical protein